MPSFTMGLALGGGAARGLAHIGVLRALERAGIKPDLITGTSIGALVGSVHATLDNAALTEKHFRRFVVSRDFRRTEFDFLKDSRRAEPSMLYSVSNLIKRGIFYSFSMTRPSFISEENFIHNIYTLVPDLAIGETKIPFFAVAADLETGAEVVLTKGSLRRAVCASSAIPGLLPPVRLDGRTLIDGGWVSKVPVLAAFRQGADMVIGVDISPELEDTRELRKGFDVLVRANAIKAEALKNFQCRLADVLIRPRVGQVHWADFSGALTLIEEGDRATVLRMPDIEEKLERGRWKTRLGFSRGKRLAKAFF
ncbi:MAG TPA: patatin-like phospholipase family protein [Candidatus Polarisedimenticolia bacterium]|nr:patatin-like phospholipase family protein [Candidatus Polarisedimenticolia bacterium]